jgi:hypothetical protein
LEVANPLAPPTFLGDKTGKRVHEEEEIAAKKLHR